MYKAGHLKMMNRPDLGFYYFLDMPLYASTNELRKAVQYQKKVLEDMKHLPEISGNHELYGSMYKKLLKAAAILTDPKKRERYLHFLKVRAYINQVSVITQIYSFQFGRVYPWMLFKIRNGKQAAIMEIDILFGCVKVTNVGDGKIALNLKYEEINGLYDCFDSSQLTLSYISGDKTAEFKFEPFYLGHGAAIVKFMELFTEFDGLYIMNRREIKWSKPGSTQIHPPKTHAASLAMHDGLVLFESDRVIPGLSGFKDEAEIVGKGVKVKLIIGPKCVLIFKNMECTDIMDLFLITPSLPKITIQEGKVEISGEDAKDMISVKFDNPSRGPDILKTVLHFQQSNFIFQYECNTFPTPQFPLNYETCLQETINAITQQDDANDQGDSMSNNESSEFEGYDYD